MKRILLFLLRFTIWSTGLFLLWFFLLQTLYIKALATVVSIISPIKTDLLSADKTGAMFRIYAARADFYIDEASISAGILVMIASLLACRLPALSKIKWLAIGIFLYFILHLVANIVIIWLYSTGAGLAEGLKIFIDGVLLTAMPVILWSIIAILEKKFDIKKIM